jgi:hypothetical protein
MVQPAFPKCTFRSIRSVKLIGLARHKFAVIALAAVALCSTIWYLLDVLGAVSHSPVFGVAAFENRFDEFRKTVQPHSTYGYVSDNLPNDPSARPEFYLTQYTLAPAIVKPTPQELLVVLNFHETRPDVKLLLANRLVMVRIFGNGVALCRRILP